MTAQDMRDRYPNSCIPSDRKLNCLIIHQGEESFILFVFILSYIATPSVVAVAHLLDTHLSYFIRRGWVEMKEARC